MRRYPVWLAVCGSVVLAGAPASLTAQGYSVNEHSSCAMGRAGTAVASPCADGSSIFFNPAGIASAAKGVWTISTGVTAIAPSGGQACRQPLGVGAAEEAGAEVLVAVEPDVAEQRDAFGSG